ncbi:MAG: metal-dependent transcriptional regulator [Dehalococcoidia bacterium]|nr:metal-dependent transcriptional regulator [Dehalococcoidia bacterium]
MQDSAVDEILEALWCSLEENKHEKWDSLVEGSKDTIARMVEAGLLTLENDHPAFTEDGRKDARAIIRRHRLAERLFNDVFDLAMQVAEDDACRFEHLLTPRAEDSVCILLGHPRTCPHGRPIPLGDCCRSRTREIRPLVLPLSRLDQGETCEVAYIGTRDEARLNRLTCLGIIPGHRLKLLQRRPAYVVEVDETHLGLDRSIAEEIYVKTVG